MTFEDFISKWNNKGIDFDGYYGDQCMDLMHQYCVEVLGLTDGRILAAPAAKDVYLGTPFGINYFDKIDNTPTGVPQKGDIMFWGTGIGPYGHVAIFIDGNASKFNSFDQNFPTGSKCHTQSHTYKGVLGWLRFKETVAEDNQAIIDELRKTRDENWNLYQGEVARNNELQNNLQEEQIKNQNLREAFDKQTEADADTGKQLLEVSHQRDAYKKNIEAVASALDANPESLKSMLTAIDTLKTPHDEVVKEVQPLLDRLFDAATYKRVRGASQGFIDRFWEWFK